MFQFQIRLPRFFNHIEKLVFIIIGFFIIAFIFPTALNQITQVSKQTTTSTTTWNSGVTQLFVLILPLIVIIGILINFMGEIGRNEYGDVVYENRWNTVTGLNQNELTAFENEILDMDMYFKKDI